MKRLIFLTGSPKTGKTTVLLRTADNMTEKGLKVGGMISQEILEKGVRVGFEICDYDSGRKGWLAHIRQPVGPRIGKYRVNLDDLNRIGTTAITNALHYADIVLIDEIGPMELFSEFFIQVLQAAVNGSKPVIATLHHRNKHRFVQQIKLRKDAVIIEVTPKTRTFLPRWLADKIIRVGTKKTVGGSGIRED